MSEILFSIKVILLTFVFMLLMQVPVGKLTVEDHAMTWIQTSSITQPIRQVAAGGVAVIHDSWKKISGLAKNKYQEKFKQKKEEAKSRLSQLKFERSEAARSSSSEEE